MHPFICIQCMSIPCCAMQIMAEYTYDSLSSVEVNIVEDVITLAMKAGGPEEQKVFSFETGHKEDIANLVASYSPLHSNWQRVGEAKTKVVSTLILTTSFHLTIHAPTHRTKTTYFQYNHPLVESMFFVKL